MPSLLPLSRRPSRARGSKVTSLAGPIAIALALAACSAGTTSRGSSSGGGASGGGASGGAHAGGAGAEGGASSGGAAGGATGGAGGAGGATGGAGGGSQTCDVGPCGDYGAGCTGCAVAGPCVDVYMACVLEPECFELNQCVGECGGDAACVDGCHTSLPGGASTFGALAECIACRACASSCSAELADVTCSPS
jgi:hypothetical protein